ncbi:MAG: hypothetical protein IT342_12820 [Candidatus Melainabacteria bacterium]|nr:hypothetical protein [Candidatus Melainabacteria bacterium]
MMHTLELQKRILSFAHRDGAREPQTELTKLVDTLGLAIASHIQSGTPPQFVALQIALVGGERVEKHLDELARAGVIAEDDQPPR